MKINDYLTEKTADLNQWRRRRCETPSQIRAQGEMVETSREIEASPDFRERSRLRPICGRDRGSARFFMLVKTEASPEFPVASPFLQEVWGQPDLAVWYILIYKDSDATKSNTLNTELRCKTCLGRAWWCASTSVHNRIFGNRK